MNLRRLLLALLCTLFAGSARADWQGDLKMKAPEGRGRRGRSMGAATGTIHASKGNVRMKIQMGPMNMDTLVQFKEHKSYLINDEAKTYMDLSERRGMAGPGANMPHCKTDSFAACMKEQGFKKVGAEEVNGQAATVWEGERKLHGPRGERVLHEKLWHPDAAGDEFAFVRVQTSSDGHESQIDVENFSNARQDPKLFELPEGYTKGQGFPMMGPPGTHPGMRGMRPPPGMPPPEKEE